MVFAGLYPVESHEHGLLRDALEKLRLNDSAFNFEPENSVALGFGFRCGFLGLLHLEIVQERLEREFKIDLITTAPGVRYRITTTKGDVMEVDNPTRFPDPSNIKQIEEPIIDASVITREDFLGGILALLEEKRGIQKKFEYIGAGRVLLLYEMPLNEVVMDFYDRLKSASRRATRRSIIIWRASASRPWCAWTCWWQASRWTRYRSSCIAISPTSAARR